MSIRAWTFLFIGLSFSLYLFIAWRSRVRDTRGFYVAGRGIPAAANGMATAADWMSAASFISMAGLISFMGYAGGVYLMGWTGGYVLLALLHRSLPPQVRPLHRARLRRRSLRVERWHACVAVLCARLRQRSPTWPDRCAGSASSSRRFLEVDINGGRRASGWPSCSSTPRWAG